MIAAPVLTGLVGPRTAVVVMSVVNFTSALLVVRRTSGVSLRAYLGLIAPLLVATLVGVTIGAQLLAVLSQPLLSGLVGLTAIIFALLAAARLQPTIPPKHRTLIGSLVGFGAGLLGGTTSVFATPIVMYFHALGISKRDFVVVLNVVLAFSTFVQILNYAGLGLYSQQVLETTLLTAACVATGVALGFRIQDRVNQRLFNWAVIVVIFLIGVNLLVQVWS
jgi:uncharacterized membrane protein YfcA